MTNIPIEKNSFPTRAFLLTALVNAIWINASEVFRYFTFIMPMIRETYPQIENVAPMNIPVFMVWGIWDTLLLFAVMGFVWLYQQRFGTGIKTALIAGTLVWLSIFGIFWLGVYNLNMTTLSILSVALPLSLIELIVAALIVNWGMQYFSSTTKATG